MSKVQSQLLVSEVTRDRADALSLIRGEPRAEVYRLALEGGGLAGMEKVHEAELDQLGELAARMGMTRLELARRAVKDDLSLADLRDRKRYPKKA